MFKRKQMSEMGGLQWPIHWINIVSLSSFQSNDRVSQTNTTNCMKCNISTWQIKDLFPVSSSVTQAFGSTTSISKPAVCFIPNQIKLSAHPYSNIW